MKISTAKPLSCVFDGFEANVTNRVGSNVYAFEVLKHLEIICRQKPEISWTVVLNTEPVDDLPKERAGWSYKVIPGALWSQWTLPRYLYQNRSSFDVLYTPSHYAPRLCPIPYVSSVMDVGYLEFPEQFKILDLLKLKHWTSYSVKKAKKVVAISEFTKSQVVTQYQKNPDDIAVAYPAQAYKKLSLSSLRRLEILKELGLHTTPYFLTVGTIQPRKNIERLVEAFEIFCARADKEILKKRASKRAQARFDQPVTLVLAGRPGWLSEPIMARIKNSIVSDQIKVLGFITEEQKAALYAQALATASVGLHEGFGIPALESQLYGTLPIVSEISSLPEVVGAAGILVDPYSVDSIADGLWKVAGMDAKKLSSERKKMKENAKKFSWHSTAEIIMDTVLAAVPTSS